MTLIKRVRRRIGVAMRRQLSTQPSVVDNDLPPMIVREQLLTGLPQENIGVQDLSSNADTVQTKNKFLDLRTWHNFRQFVSNHFSPKTPRLPHISDNEQSNDNNIFKKTLLPSNDIATLMTETSSLPIRELELVYQGETETGPSRQHNGIRLRSSNSSKSSSAGRYSPPPTPRGLPWKAVTINVGKGYGDPRPVELLLDNGSCYNIANEVLLEECKVKSRPLREEDQPEIRGLGGKIKPTHYVDLVLKYRSDEPDHAWVERTAKFYVAKQTEMEDLLLLVGRDYVMTEANKIRLRPDAPAKYCFVAWSKSARKISEGTEETGREGYTSRRALLTTNAEDLEQRRHFREEQEAAKQADDAKMASSRTRSSTNPSGSSQGKQAAPSSHTDTSSVSNPDASMK